jgi:two-component system, LuxR family, response regulator FixJ
MAPRGKVYVIDDDDAMRDSLDFLLGSADFDVTLFESAQHFLDALPSIDFGCVVSDVRMPGIDGIELLKRLKAGPQSLPGTDHDRAWRRSTGGRGDEAWRGRFPRKAVRG